MRRTGSGTVLILLLLSMSSSFFNLQETRADPQPQPQLETDKRIYRLGQNITVILTNIGNETLWIGGYPPWQISAFPEKEPVYPKFFATLAWELDPGENDTYVWNRARARLRAYALYGF